MTVSSDAPILVAVDFSASSEAAFAWAVEAARAYGTPLMVLHVVHDPANNPGFYAEAAQGKITDQEEVAVELMDGFIARMRAQVPQVAEIREFDASVVVGLPVTRILEVANREGARMIVMGGEGRTALADALLGSNVERVARLSPIPVVVVKMGEARPLRPHPDAVDG